MQSVRESLNLAYPSEPASVAAGRRALSEFAAQAGADQVQVHAVQLACSEALTNAVLHAYRQRPGSIHVIAAVVGNELWILVADDGCGLQARADRPGLGLGLGLISQLSDDFVIVPRAAGGTEVRMRFDIEGALRSAPGVACGSAPGRRPDWVP